MTSIFCIKCNANVDHVLKKGSVVYPLNKKLKNKNYLRCNSCKILTEFYNKSKIKKIKQLNETSNYTTLMYNRIHNVVDEFDFSYQETYYQ